MQPVFEEIIPKGFKNYNSGHTNIPELSMLKMLKYCFHMG